MTSSAQIAADTIPHANCGFGHGLKGAPNPNPPNAPAGLPFNNYNNANAILTCNKFQFYFNDEDQEAIQNLAFSCPYLEGNSVFKARTLFSSISPNNYYDDLFICNGQGVYKVGISSYEAENNLLSGTHTKGLPTENIVSIYPNPSNGSFNLEYNLSASEAWQLEITDLFGKKISTQSLKGKQAVYNITLPAISTGIYLYSLRDNKGVKYTGKLIIE